MPSLHTDRAFAVAVRKGAFSAHKRADWEMLMSMSKRELVEIAVRLGAMCSESGSCDDPEAGCERVFQERDTLRANGII